LQDPRDLRGSLELQALLVLVQLCLGLLVQLEIRDQLALKEKLAPQVRLEKLGLQELLEILD
jgi:hypothetical protein